MSTFANVFVGNTANDGSGDPLRTAFLKIDENFAKIASGEIGVTVNAPIQSVAGRSQANIILSVADVNGAVGVLRVNTLDANLGTATNNITALQSNVSEIEADLAEINANVTAANAAIASFVVGAGFALETELTSNVASLQHKIDLVNANVTASNLRLSSVATTTSTNSTNITILQSDAGVQATALNRIDANLGTATNNITTLQSNAGVQATALNRIDANLGTATNNITSLRANITAANLVNASQGSAIYSINATIDTINEILQYQDANLGTATTNITALQSTVGSHTTQINLVNANLTAANSALWSNALQQSTAINNLNASLVTTNHTVSNNSANILVLQSTTGILSSAVDLINANATASNNSIAQLNAGATAANLRISTIDANLGTATNNITSLRANITAANAAILSKAPIVSPTFVGNITTGNILAQGFFWANGTPFTSDSSLVSEATLVMKAYIDANVSTLNSRIDATNAAVISANSFNQSYTTTLINKVNANVTAANAQISSLQSSISSIANLASLSGSLIPSAANTYNLGTTIKPWANAYIGNVSVGLGEFNKIYNNETFTWGNTTTLGRLTVTNGVFWANGTPFTTSGGSYGNIEVVAQLQHLSTNVTTSGSIIAGTYYGDGSKLSGVTVNLETALHTYGGDILADNVIANAFIGNGAGLTNVPSTFGNANVSIFLGDKFKTTANIYGNIYADYLFYANGTRRSYGDKEVQTFLVGGTVTSIVTGNVVSVGNVYSNGNIAMVSSVPRNIYVNSSAPLSTQGNVGDIWYQTF